MPHLLPLLLFGAGGVILASLALALALRTVQFQLRASKTVATIISSRVSNSQVTAPEPGETELRAVAVEFEDEAGAKQYGIADMYGEFGVAWGNKRLGRSAPRFGNQVPILYDRDKPSSVRVDRFVELWFAPFVIGVMAAVYLTVTISMWLSGVW